MYGIVSILDVGLVNGGIGRGAATVWGSSAGGTAGQNFRHAAGSSQSAVLTLNSELHFDQKSVKMNLRIRR
jgi:outer membrane lipoprotein SlyB